MTSPSISEEDPIVMYLIVRENLNMSVGKTSAQCAHAAQLLTVKYFNLKRLISDIQKGSPHLSTDDQEKQMATYKNIAPYISIFGEWMAHSYRKVVLRANDKEWARLKEECKDEPHTIVVDAGLTELQPNTETVMGLWPIRKSQVPKVVKRLQVLK